METTLCAQKYNSHNSKFTKVMVVGTIINLIFMISHAYSLNTLTYLGVMIIIAYSTIVDEYSNLLLLFFLVPNQRDIVLFGSDITLINIIILTLFLKLVSQKGKLDIVQLMLVLCFSIYSLNTAFRFSSFSVFFIVIKSSFFIITLSMFFRKYSPNYNLYLMSVKSLVYGAISAGLIGLFFNFIFDNRFARFTAGVNNDPNIYGSILSFAFANLLILTFTKKIEKEKWFVPGLLMVSLFGLLTQSRAFILTWVVSLLLYFLFQKSIKQKAKILILVLGLISTLFIVYTQFPEAGISRIMHTTFYRIANPRNDDISGGRIDLWTIYIDFLRTNIEYLLLGIGTSFRDFGFISVAHNMIIDAFVIYGFIGFIFICLLYNTIWKTIVKASLYKRIKLRNRIIFIIPLIAILVSNFTLYDIFGIGLIIQMVISFLCLSVGQMEH